MKKLILISFLIILISFKNLIALDSIKKNSVNGINAFRQKVILNDLSVDGDNLEESNQRSEQKQDQPLRYDRAALELGSFIAGLWSYDRYVTKQPWAVIGTKSIKANFEHGFEWDRGEFGMNQLLHPYSGSIYFNSARTNNLSFETSAIFTLGGSLTWELFMENHYPSMNDMITTTLGGIALGEVLFRLSNLMIDESTTGKKRINSEILATIINPMNGLNRFLNGDWNKKGESTKDSNMKTKFVLGGNSEQQSHRYSKMQPHVMFGIYLEYNELFQETDIRRPFDYFDLLLAAMAYEDNTIPMIKMQGHLYGREITTEHFSIIVGSFLQYNFTNTAIMKLSTTSIGPGMEIRSNFNDKYMLQGGFHLQGIVLGAIDSPYHVKRMDYNLGPGYSTFVHLEFGHIKGLKIEAVVGRYIIFNEQGADGTEEVYTSSVNGSFPLYRSVRFGVEYGYYKRYGNYDDHPNTSFNNDMIRTYLSVEIE
jgi:Domain of unknown function (DUF3943)